MDVESVTNDVDTIGVDLGEQETRFKKAKSGGTERVPGKSIFPVARVQKILKADKVRGYRYILLFASIIDNIDPGTTYSSERGCLSCLNCYSESIVDQSCTLNLKRVHTCTYRSYSSNVSL